VRAAAPGEQSFCILGNGGHMGNRGAASTGIWRMTPTSITNRIHNLLFDNKWIVYGLLLSNTCFADQVRPAFAISKDINSNVVQYDVNLTDDCQFKNRNPFNIYWARSGSLDTKDRDKLNFIEKALYGVDVREFDSHQLTGEIKALQKRRIKVQLRMVAMKEGGSCTIKTYASGAQLPKEIELSSIRLEKFEGETPKQLALKAKEENKVSQNTYIIGLG
jgi:hypothetical protein